MRKFSGPMGSVSRVTVESEALKSNMCRGERNSFTRGASGNAALLEDAGEQVARTGSAVLPMTRCCYASG